MSCRSPRVLSQQLPMVAPTRECQLRRPTLPAEIGYARSASLHRFPSRWRARRNWRPWPRAILPRKDWYKPSPDEGTAQLAPLNTQRLLTFGERARIGANKLYKIARLRNRRLQFSNPPIRGQNPASTRTIFSTRTGVGLSFGAPKLVAPPAPSQPSWI
jgi:hypothetical protein